MFLFYLDKYLEIYCVLSDLINNIFIDDEERLAINIFKGYNSLIRPSPCYNQTINYIDFGMAMILLINVDEKNQVMQSNACWNPKEYSNIESIRVPVDRVWVPDIVLFNNADGNYEVSYQSNVVVDYQGNVSWVPPAIYKSSCRIDVEYFPFDEQTFIIWFIGHILSKRKSILRWYGNINVFVDFRGIILSSGIWDIMDVPGRMSLDKSRVEFRIVIRRKTLFYTIILIIPTVLMAFLSMLVFYLPAECSEKITLAISILLALVVFLLLVSKILPPTSDTIPLMAKYLLMIFVMNIITIMSTVCVLNVHFRSALTHQMPQSVRILFLSFLPKLLCMPLPKPLRRNFGISSIRHRPLNVRGGRRLAEAIPKSTEIVGNLPFTFNRNLSLKINNKEERRRKKQKSHSLIKRKYFLTKEEKRYFVGNDRSLCSPLPQLRKSKIINSSKYLFLNKFSSQNLIEKQEELSNLMAKGVSGVQFIYEHIRAEMDDKKIRDEWRFISMVIDRLLSLLFFGITLGVFSTKNIFSSIAEERLIKDLFRGYNHLIRPVANKSNSPLEIRFSLALILLINIDEKNQIMQTNVWPTMKWIDYQMKWFLIKNKNKLIKKRNPSDYENIRTIRVPPEKVWLPDIVLFNNADGNYEVSFYSNVVIENNGEMLWVPPAIYKSSCIIDVEFFPFDEQTCAMIFGSWTFNKEEVIISYLGNKRQVELNDYSESAIWDLMEVPGQLINQKSKISYQIKIRRKTLFYTVILIVPTVLMAFLSMLVFYLPAECSEKITLAISILLALVVFLLLVSKILPPTSDTIPLMAKYLLMIFVLNIITIIVTVIIINIYFRGPTTHKMPSWVYSIFICKLPLLLMMNRPQNIKNNFSKKFSLNSLINWNKENKQKNIKYGKFIEMNKIKK
uniref:Neur_chan_LBD domain-containing protein n=1 Tax=Meloidogyne hapla TaxID=6305 RepID=A0A1I8BHJ7_MELHA